MIGYVKWFYSNKVMSFKVSDGKPSKRYANIWRRVSSLIDKEFARGPVYGDSVKQIKTKIKSYHPQTLLEKCKNEIKKNKVENIIKDNFDSSSYDQSENESYNESENKPDHESNASKNQNCILRTMKA